jgi:SAM-dependent methyltransferase
MGSMDTNKQRPDMDNSITSDFHLKYNRDLQELSGKPTGATSGNAYSWIIKGNIVKQLVGDSNSLMLEIGCGWGRNLSQFPQAIGIDISLPFLKTAHNYVDNDVVLADAYHLPFRDNVFNSVIMTEVIEHLDDARPVITEVARVIQPNGKFVLTTPNKNISRFANVTGHVHEFDFNELCNLLKTEGFNILERKGGTIPYIPGGSSLAWLDYNKVYFQCWKLLNKISSPFSFLKWDLIILTRLR